MPFVIRKVEPRLLCRGHVPPGPQPDAGAELESVAHGALTGCLKQLASLLTLAEDIFAELTLELTVIAERSGTLRQRVDRVDERLGTIDPKKIPVPESDISTFASRKEHFHAKNSPKTTLFTVDTRPKILKELYEAAAMVAVKSLDSISRDGRNNSTDMYLCTPVLGKRRRDESLDIESRVPAVIEDLRRWTSTEALGDVTVPPDCMSRILTDTTDDDAVDHKLPSPEEQVQAVALKFPAEVVAVDVSGRGFERMSIRRRSLLSPGGQEQHEVSVKRRSRPRRPRGKRRNTIAGIDQKEIRQAIGGETTAEDLEEEEASPSVGSRAQRSASTDILGSKKDSPTEKKSHFNTLKAWGMSRLKLISPKSSQSVQEAGATGSNQTGDSQSTDDNKQQIVPTEETNIYETVTMRRRKEKFHERKPSSSSSSGKSTSSIPVSIPCATERQVNVKLRESAAQRRERRKGNREDAPHSSSGNWSASSESGRASIGSETTTTTHPPRSTTTASIGTSSTSLSHVRRPKGRDTSASSSVTSEGTLTPDIIHDITAVPFSDDGENSSVYSCDTEGYYTSFHVDSGLKTLREEESLPQSPLTKSCDLGPDPTSPVAENEYELFGRGSTSTTTSSAGTVCTTLLAPPPPERKSSLTVVAMVHGQTKNGGQSPDSGHNTSSSPVESASSPACTGRSCSEFEYSESSDLEGCERVERIRSKTAINVSRIPSMCVITPPGSDDETVSKEPENFRARFELRDNELANPGSILMSATVGTSKMEVINGQDKNPYATVQTIVPDKKEFSNDNQRRNIAENFNTAGGMNSKTSPLSGVLEKLRGVLPGGKRTIPTKITALKTLDVGNPDSGDYVTIADVRNNNNKRSDHVSRAVARSSQPATYANTELFEKEAEYVSLSELPKKQDSSLERRRQGARVTLDSEGKVVYSSDSLKRRKGAHTTFNPGPFVKEETSSPGSSPLLHRAQATVRAVNRDKNLMRGNDTVDLPGEKSTAPTSPQLGKLIIRAPKSPERTTSPNCYVRTPSTVVRATSPTSPQKQMRGAYVNVQGEEDSALLAVPKESVVPPSDVSIKQQQQPPPYIEPPKLKNHRDTLNREITRTTRTTKKSSSSSDIQKLYNKSKNLYRKDGGDYCDGEKETRETKECYEERNNGGEYSMRNNHRTIVDDKSRPDYYQTNYTNNEQFYTLPNYKTTPRTIVEPQRSVTPDITRGLARAPALNTMHMMARRGQNFGQERYQHPTNKLSNEGDYHGSRNGNTEGRNYFAEHFGKKDQCQQRQEESNGGSPIKNRLIVPASLAAVGYRFVTGPPCHITQGWKSPGGGSSTATDPLRHARLSPIGPSGNRSFQSSTPGNKETGYTNANAHYSGNSDTQHNSNSSAMNTRANLILSPTRSTMSNEELFAAIHKSKRRLNIKEDTDSNVIPPDNYTRNEVSTRHSWSPESHKTPVVPKSVTPISTTSRLDFKRLLLQQSVKTGPTRLSAAEQLKISRQQTQQQQQQQQQQQLIKQHQEQKQNRQEEVEKNHQTVTAVTPVKILSPRAVWRFQSPRSDVLSSTIIEDAAAEEKAMKPSPENPSPLSRLNIKRQLDLGAESSLANNENEDISMIMKDDREHDHHNHHRTTRNINNDNRHNQNGEKNSKLLIDDVPNQSIIDNYVTAKNISSQINDGIQFKETDKIESTNDVNDTDDRSTKNKTFASTARKTTPTSTPTSTSSTTNQLSTAESRRINNQLARAQFLASFPKTVLPSSSPGQDKTANYFARQNRARSESPQHGIPQNVSRSPSAPTLETAL